MSDSVTTIGKIERPVGLVRTLRSVIGAWFSGRPVCVMTGPIEIRCEYCKEVAFAIERKT